MTFEQTAYTHNPLMKPIDASLKNICEFLFRVMLFMAVFDGIRSRTPIGEQVTVLKEVCTFSLLGVILFSYRGMISKKMLEYTNVILLLYIVVFGTIAISINDINRDLFPAVNRKDLAAPFAMHFKNIESIIIVFVLLHYGHLTGRNIAWLLDYFVHLCVGYVLFTLLFYFVIDTTFFQKPWYGRISIGYPTSDAQILCFALAYLVFEKTSLTSLVKGMFIIILTAGIIMNATATGMVGLGLIFAGYVIYYFYSGKIKRIFSFRNFIYLGVAMTIFFLARQLLLNLNQNASNYASLLETKMGFLTSRITQYFSSTPATIDYNVDFSEEVRTLQIEKAFTYNRDLVSMIVGGPISVGTFIENENYFLIRSYGYVGLALYYWWILLLVWKGLIGIKQSQGRLLLAAIAILVLTNSAIITTYLFGIAVSFGLFVAFFYHQNEAAELAAEES